MKTWPRTNRLRIRNAHLWSVVVFFATVLSAGDWPQYRGPNHDGISIETIRTNWSVGAPRQVWKVPLDPALSSFSVSGGKAFTMVRRPVGNADQEFCIALNADTGAELWASLPLGIADYPNGGVGTDDGPRSTPSVDGERVYILTSYLRLYCLSATNGAVVWSKDLVAQYGSTVIPWQSAASPLIEGDLVFVIGNATGRCLVAFHKSDGAEAWMGQDDVMTQASPVAATIAGARQIIFYTQSGLVSVVPETGVVLWRHPLRYNGTSVAASPVVGGDRVYCSRAYPNTLSAAQAGALVVSLTNSGAGFSSSQVWFRTNQLMNHWCTPVHYKGYGYGMYGQGLLTFKCIEFATGTEKWTVDGFGYGSVLVVGGNVLALSDWGELALVQPNPDAYTEIARYRALDGSQSSFPGLVRCWNVPAISNGRIYVRSTTEAVALDVSVPAAPPLKLNPALATGSAGTFRLFIGNEDGSPLDTNRLANIDIFASTNLTLGLSGWIKLTNPAVLTNGQLRLDDRQSAATPGRFFRVEERP